LRDYEEALQRAINGVKELSRIEGQTSVEVSPDKQTIATITKDGKVRLSDFRGKERKVLRHDKEEIINIYFSQDGSKIATVSVAKNEPKNNSKKGEGQSVTQQTRKHSIKLWNSQGQEIQSFEPIDKFDNIIFSPNDKLIVTKDWRNGTAKLWKIEGKQLIDLLPDEKFNIDYNLNSSKDGNTIATVSGEGENRKIKVWTLKGKQLIPLLPDEKFNDVDFGDDGNTIATVSGEGDKYTVKLWNSQGQLIQRFSSIENSDYIQIKPNHKLIVTKSTN